LGITRTLTWPWRERVNSALKIAHITHEALMAGSYGNASLIAGVTDRMFSTLQFNAGPTVAPHMMKTLEGVCKEPGAARVFDLAQDIRKDIRGDDDGKAFAALSHEVIGAVSRG
jgi:hypothetical protein